MWNWLESEEHGRVGSNCRAWMSRRNEEPPRSTTTLREIQPISRWMWVPKPDPHLGVAKLGEITSTSRRL